MGEYFPLGIFIIAFYTEKNLIVVHHCQNDVFMVFTFVQIIISNYQLQRVLFIKKKKRCALIPAEF